MEAVRPGFERAVAESAHGDVHGRQAKQAIDAAALAYSS
jgi:hypothetical protein